MADEKIAHKAVKSSVTSRQTVAPPIPEDRADPMPETAEQAQALARIQDEEAQEPEKSERSNVTILFRKRENGQLETLYVTNAEEAEAYAKEFGGILVKAVQYDPPRDLTDEDRELPADRAMRLAKKMEREAFLNR